MKKTLEELIDSTAVRWASQNDVYGVTGLEELKKRMRENVVSAALNLALIDRKFIESIQRATDE